MFVTYWMWRGSVCSDKGFELLCHSVIIRHQVPLKTDPYIVGTASTHRWLVLTHFFHVHREPFTLYQVFMYQGLFYLPSFCCSVAWISQDIPHHLSCSGDGRCRSNGRQTRPKPETKGPALTDNKSVCSFFLALPALMTLVDRPNQLFYIWISLCCKYTNLRSRAGQSAVMA